MTGQAVAPPARRDSMRSARLGLSAVVVGAAIFLFATARGLWFGGDDWFIITDRGLTSGPGRQGLFEPHFEHWSTLPILAWRGLYSTFGLHTYWPYIGLTIVVHLVIVVLLWYVMTRAAVDGWVATCGCAVFAAAGTGFENLINAWQTQLILPLALGLGAILVAPESGRRFTARDAVAAVLLTAAVMSSGVALPMLVAVGLVLVVRRSLRLTALTLVVPVVAYGWWYLTYGREGEVADPAPEAIPRFVWHGLADALGDEARINAIGTIVVLAVVGWVAYRLVRFGFERDLTVPFALAIAAVAFLAGTGYRRGNLISTGPAQSRYAYVTVALVLPLVARAGQGLLRGSRGRRVLLAAVTIVLVVAQARKLDDWATLARPGKQSDRGAVLATAALVREGRTLFQAAPLSLYEPQVSVAEVVSMDRDGKLPPLDQATTRDFLTVLARLNVVVTPDPVIPPAIVARVESMRHVDATDDAPGCIRLRTRADNEVVLRLDGPGTFRIRGEGLMDFRLRDPKQHIDGDRAPAVLAPDRDNVVSVATDDDLVVLTLPIGSPIVLCDLAEVPGDTRARTP